MTGARAWKPLRLRFAFDEVDQRLGMASTSLPLLSVSIHHGVRRRDETTDRAARADEFTNYKRVEPGDVVINRMRAFEGGAGVSKYSGIVSGDYAVLRTRRALDARFLHHLIRSTWFVGEMTARLRGIGNIEQGNVRTPRINVEDLGNIAVPLPPPGEQRAIADYLDLEASRTDRMVGGKRRIVALLEERIDAEVLGLVGTSALVTGAKTSELLPIRRLLVKQYRVAETDRQMITAFRDGQVTARSLRRTDGYTESWLDGSQLQGVRRGDVVVHGLDGFAGAIGASEVDGVCSPVYHVCSVGRGGDPEFFGRMLRLLATTGYLGNFATSTRERAVDFRNWDLFGSIPVPVVDQGVQRRIGDRIRALRPLREVINASEKLVLERRQALITAAVTGQLEIPGVAA